MSQRKSDTKKEVAVAKFLDSYFYSKPSIHEFVRHSGEREQLDGIDVSFKIKSQKILFDTLYFVDEKCAAHYVNKDIPTFAFELQFNNKLDTKTRGWLYDDSKKTSHYLLVWIKTNLRTNNFDFKNITELEVMLISRDSIKKILEDKKFKIEDLDFYTKKMLDGKNLDEKQHFDFGSFKLHYSGHLDEKSINVTIKKSELSSVSIGHFSVTPNTITKLKKSNL